MDTTFSDVLRRFKTISTLECEEETSIQVATGGKLGYQYGSPKADDYHSEFRPCQAALRAFLKALPVAHVFTLTALMYSGRDGRDDPVSYWSELKSSFGTKEQAALAILEKSPRMDYIERVLPKIEKLDELPTRIAGA